MTTPAYGHRLQHPRSEIAAALADASTVPFWLDRPRPEAAEPLSGAAETDLLVIGGGFCGLWTALMAKERQPERDVILIEAKEVAWAASGRNGGFAESSLTHGADNGRRRFGDELDAIEELADENWDGFRAAVARYGIDADLVEEGVLRVATEPHQVEELRAHGAEVLEGDALRDYTRSPVARAATLHAEGAGLVDPVKLAWGLRAACQSLGVRIFEHTPAVGLRDASDRVEVRTRNGRITARRVALATNGFRPLLKRLALRTVPIYDYVLMTEPLTAQQLADIGWVRRYGISDMSRQFHYYRKTADDRILWGGYDAVYHAGRRITTAQDQRPQTFERLADHFFTTFPQLRGVAFTHKWGGMIDMSTKFVSFQGTALGGKVAYSLGYTGLGVVATRFGADVMLDLVDGIESPRTRLAFPRVKPFPVPPEPIAYPAIQTMRAAVARSDANGGRDGVLLRIADAFGIGFDS